MSQIPRARAADEPVDLVGPAFFDVEGLRERINATHGHGVDAG